MAPSLGRDVIGILNFVEHRIGRWFGDVYAGQALSIEQIAEAVREGWRTRILSLLAYRQRTVAAIEREATGYTRKEIVGRVEKLSRVGLVERVSESHRGPIYGLSDRCRRLTGLLAIVARLEHTQMEPGFDLTPDMIVSGLLSIIPLVSLPRDVAGSAQIAIKGPPRPSGEDVDLAFLSFAIHEGVVSWILPMSYPESVERLSSMSKEGGGGITRSQDALPGGGHIEDANPGSWFTADPLSALRAFMSRRLDKFNVAGHDDGALLKKVHANLRKQIV